MKVAASFDKEEYYASETAKADFSAVYLFGGSAAGSPYEVNCFLSPFAFSPKKNKSYSYSIFNPTDLPPQGLKIGAVAGELDREGKGKAECKIDDLDEKTPQSSLIEALVSVFESGGGRSTVKKTSAKMHPEKFYLGLKTNLKSAERNDKIITEGIIADWEGEKLPISIDVQIDLKKVETEYGYYYYEDEWDGGYNSGRSKRITLMKSMT
jgi:uncharacterized protein YfaS (alpha-2-macroglobulin family)